MLAEIDKARQSVSNILDRVLYTREELALRERDKRMMAIFKRKWPPVNSAEIYEADFGTSCPNGLDIKTYPEHPVYIMGIKDMPDFSGASPEEQQKMLETSAGMALPDGRIYIHPAYYDEDYLKARCRSFSSTLAHEHAHTAQFYERDDGWPSAFNNNNTQFLHINRGGNGFAAGIGRLYQKLNRASMDRQAQKITTSKVSDYLANEYEIQARMHEVLAIGYAAWQKMPENKTELWAALHNAGIRTPKNILKELKSSEEGRQALKRFKCSRTLQENTRKTAKELNFVDKYAGFADVRETLWRKAYPALYGNLLEHYGDRPGRARMGLGHNPAAAKKVTSALQHDPLSLTPEKIATLLDDVHPDNAGTLANVLGEIADKGPPVRKKKALFIIDEMLQHENLRGVLFSKGVYDRAKGHYDCPPLLDAVIEGRPEVVRTFIEAGADPFQNIKILNPFGKATGEDSLFGYIPILKGWEKDLERPAGFMNKLKNVFNDHADANPFLRDQIMRSREALQVIADHYPALDEVRTAYGCDGVEKQVTARALLAEIGIAPKKDITESADERARQENHVAFERR